MWTASEISEDKNAVTFSRISPDGENGFPGEFNVSVTYEMTEENELRIVYGGVCDQTTIANMTNHSYFNLAGEGSGSAMDQYLTIHAEQYTPVGEGSIPVSYTHLDVYKRQVQALHRRQRHAERGLRRREQPPAGVALHHRDADAVLLADAVQRGALGHDAVSYTHLDVYKRQGDARVAVRRHRNGLDERRVGEPRQRRHKNQVARVRLRFVDAARRLRTLLL